MNIASKIKKHGAVGSAKRAVGLAIWKAKQVRNVYYRWAVRKEPKYVGPNVSELAKIEGDLHAAGITVHDYFPRVEDFSDFQAANYFPQDYCGGASAPVWVEKLLEHWVAAERLGLMSYQSTDIYVDVAAANSPWAMTLRERHGIAAFAIDLCEIGSAYKHLPFYRIENATSTTFSDASVSGVSLQCAYEMFMRDDDTNLLK